MRTRWVAATGIDIRLFPLLIMKRSISMHRSTVIMLSVLLVVILLAAMHTLNLVGLLGALNPHARP
jgi:hypothetical protein